MPTVEAELQCGDAGIADKKADRSLRAKPSSWLPAFIDRPRLISRLDLVRRANQLQRMHQER